MNDQNLCGATVVNIRTDDYNLYIGRRVGHLKNSPFRNPFKLSDFKTREDCVAKFETYLRSNQDLLSELHMIDGQRLACWCKPALCHGDILIKVRNEQLGTEAK